METLVFIKHNTEWLLWSLLAHALFEKISYIFTRRKISRKSMFTLRILLTTL